MKRYPTGNQIRLTGTFTNLAGAAIDPSTVSLMVTNPAGTCTNYVYGSSAVAKDSVGVYHYDLDAIAVGQWTYRWYSTGTGQAARSTNFLIIP